MELGHAVHYLCRESLREAVEPIMIMIIILMIMILFIIIITVRLIRNE